MYSIISGSRLLMIPVIGLFLLFSSLSMAADQKKAENFTLKDVTGKTHSLSDYTEARAIVVMFIATQCPISNDYNTRMVKIYQDYQDKDIVFLGINSNKQESVEEIIEHASKNSFQFPVLKDPENVIADKFEAQVTPEIFVMNSKFEILYHGRIDDSQRENEVKSSDLRKALDEILAGKAVTTTQTKAFGCTIKRVAK